MFGVAAMAVSVFSVWKFIDIRYADYSDFPHDVAVIGAFEAMVILVWLGSWVLGIAAMTLALSSQRHATKASIHPLAWAGFLMGWSPGFAAIGGIVYSLLAR
jgi:hypothetical protein